MPKAKPRRKFRRYIKGVINHDLELATLAAVTLISEAMADTVDETTFISSVVASVTLSDFPQAADDGPISVGWAHSDYSDTEIEEWIERPQSWREANLVSREINKRLIRILGTFSAPGEPTGSAVLNHGRPVKMKLNWTLTTGQTVRLWAYNHGASALATGAVVTVLGHANLWPR